MFLILDKDKYQVRPLTNMSDTVHTCEANQQQPKKAECPFSAGDEGLLVRLTVLNVRWSSDLVGPKPPLELRT